VKEIVSRIHKAFSKACEKNLNLEMGPQADYDEGDIATVLEYASENVISVTEAAPQLRDLGYDIPDGDTLLYHFSKVNHEKLEVCFGGIIATSMHEAKRQRLIGIPLDVAIDFNDVPWYGKKKRFTIRTKHRNGTCYFIRFAVLTVVFYGRRFVVAVVPVMKKTKNENVVEALLTQARQYLRIRRVFLDRIFYNAKVVKKLDELKAKYVIPAKKTAPVKRAMKKLLRGKERITDYTVRNSKGDKADTTLFLSWNRRRRKWQPFITNISVNELTRASLGEAYRKRFSIETSFRVKNGFRIRTCSGVYSIRYAFYLVALCVYNFWILLNVWEARRFGETPNKPLITVYRFVFLIEKLVHSGAY
jgi:IS4 transposase